MSRYFFHAVGDNRDLDTGGTELPDEQTAMTEAVRYAGELLRWKPEELLSTGRWRVEVTNESGELVFTMMTIALDATQPPRPLRRPANCAND